MFRGSWVLGLCAGVAVVPYGRARAEGPVEAAAPEVTDSRAPAVEVSSAKRVRHDVYFGMGTGVGGGTLGNGDGGALVVTGWARVGGRLREKVGLGASLSSSFGTNFGATTGFTSVLFEAMFFPIKKRGLGLGVGLGFSSVRRRDYYDVSEQGPGAGMALSVGYDFWLARRFNFGLWLRADASASGYGLASAGTFGIGLSWY